MEVRDQVVRNNRAWGNSRPRHHAAHAAGRRSRTTWSPATRGFFIYDVEYASCAAT